MDNYNEVFTRFVNKSNSMWAASSCNPYLCVQVRRWACPKPSKFVLKSKQSELPFLSNMSFLAYFHVFQHGSLGGASHNAKSPHNVPYSIQTTSQCSSGKSRRTDGQAGTSMLFQRFQQCGKGKKDHSWIVKVCVV